MSLNRKFRITLWAINTTSGSAGGWRGDQKAVIFDAKSIGVEEFANDTGSAYWTLDNDHPQIAELVPLERHYEICRWSDQRSRWEFVAAGMLNDYSAGEYETSFSGLDYKAVLNQLVTPLVDITVQNTAPLNPDLGSILPGVIGSASTSAIINTSDLSVSSLTLTPYTNFEYVDTGGPAVRAQTEAIEVSWTASWTGTTTGWPTGAIGINYYLYVSPTAEKDSSSPPLTSKGLIAQISSQSISATGVNRFKWASRSVFLLGADFQTFWNDALYNSIDIIDPDGNNVGPPLGDPISSLAIDTTVSYSGEIVAAPLRKGVSYSFQVYAAVVRTTPAATYRSYPPSQTLAADSTPTFPQVTLGQENVNAQVAIANIYQEAVTSDDYGRLRNTAFRTLSVISSGSTATTHRSFSAGEPLLDRIAVLADLEMGAKTSGAKVVFGITKPINGNTYSGGFTLNMNISSAASTAIHLRYPDNIKSFNYSPGFSRVRNDITVVPSVPYLSGGGGQLSGGVLIIGAQAINTATLNTYGRILSVVQRAGLYDSSVATNEANRLLNTSNAANTKQVGLSVVLDAIDLWNGWDLGESVRVTINRGLTVINEPFVISGVRWFGESNGQERVELELVQGTAFSAAKGV